MTDQALELLKSAGAATIAHPGGTLLAHLQRVSALLASWSARPALVSAGLCHAFYGTDGFAVTLLNLDERAVLAQAIGEEAEALVYFYASCDRMASYRSLPEPDSVFVNRFTGDRARPTIERRRDFAELTAPGTTFAKSSTDRADLETVPGQPRHAAYNQPATSSCYL